MRRYSIWCESWADILDFGQKPVFIQRCWTRKGMVRKVRRLNGNLPFNAKYRFYGQEDR